jgi:hypothetical protein
MLKAGLIGAAVGFVLAVVGAVLFPLLCNPCAAVFVGLGAGILAGVFTRPSTSGASAGEGAKGGTIATVGNLFGQMVGTAVSVSLVGPETAAEAAAEMSRQFGLVPVDPATFSGMYLPLSFGGGCVCALFGVALGAGLGAVGGLLWHQIAKQGQEFDKQAGAGPDAAAENHDWNAD